MRAVVGFLLLAMGLFHSRSVGAIQWEVIGQDSETPVYSGHQSVALEKSVGENSLKIFVEQGIPHKGEPEGFQSILNTPVGLDAIVVESNTRMRAYGWCFEVDGVQPELMPSKVFFNSQESRLRWFFAYSVYDNGVWKDYCSPAFRNPLKKP